MGFRLRKLSDSSHKSAFSLSATSIGKSSIFSVQTKSRREFTRSRWCRSLTLYALWRIVLFFYFFGFLIYHYGGWKATPDDPLPILFLPSVAELMGFFYSFYSLVIVLAVGCREGGPMIRNEALCGHKLVGLLYHISIVACIFSSTLWFALQPNGTWHGVSYKVLTFHLIIGIPTMLLWDLWISRYSIRPLQVISHGGIFLIGWACLFLTVVGARQYFEGTGYFSESGLTGSALKNDTSDIYQNFDPDLNRLSGQNNVGNLIILDTDKTSLTLKAQNEDFKDSQMIKRKKQRRTKIKKNLKNATKNKRQKVHSKRALALAAEEDADTLEELKKFKEKYEALQKLNLRDLAENSSLFDSLIGPSITPYQKLLGWTDFSWTGVKRPLILGTLVFIGLLVVIVILLKTIEYTREVLYRIYAFWRNTFMCVWCINCWNYHVEKKTQLKRDREMAKELKAERDRQIAEQEALEMGEAITGEKHPFPIVITDDKDKPVPKPIRISSSPDRHASGLTKRTEFVEEINAASINNSMLSIGKNSMEEFDGSFSRRSRSPVKNTSRGQVEVKVLGLYFSDLRINDDNEKPTNARGSPRPISPVKNKQNKKQKEDKPGLLGRGFSKLGKTEKNKTPQINRSSNTRVSVAHIQNSSSDAFDAFVDASFHTANRENANMFNSDHSIKIERQREMETGHNRNTWGAASGRFDQSTQNHHNQHHNQNNGRERNDSKNLQPNHNNRKNSTHSTKNNRNSIDFRMTEGLQAAVASLPSNKIEPSREKFSVPEPAQEEMNFGHYEKNNKASEKIQIEIPQMKQEPNVLKVPEPTKQEPQSAETEKPQSGFFASMFGGWGAKPAQPTDSEQKQNQNQKPTPHHNKNQLSQPSQTQTQEELELDDRISPTLQKYSQEPVRIEDGAYTYQSTGAVKELDWNDFDQEMNVAREQHYYESQTDIVYQNNNHSNNHHHHQNYHNSHNNNNNYYNKYNSHQNNNNEDSCYGSHKFNN